MDLQLKSKVIVIAGEIDPVGMAVMHAVAGEGAIPCLVGNWAESGQEKISAEPRDTAPVFIRKELTDKEACREVMREIGKRFRQVDVLVNISPTIIEPGLEQGTMAGFEATLRGNLLPSFLLTQELLPTLKGSKGAILNIFRTNTNSREPGETALSGVSGGHAALTREWAVELLSAGIRVNALVLTSGGFGETREEDSEIKQHNGRLTRIAQTVAFLVSPRSGHTTGQLVYAENNGSGDPT